MVSSRLALRAFGMEKYLEGVELVHTANSLPKLLLEVLVVVEFRFARIALALLNQMALGNEPA
jgi:hypothetical protein